MDEIEDRQQAERDTLVAKGTLEQRTSQVQIADRKVRGLIPYNAEARLNGFTETIATGALKETRLDGLYVTIDHADRGLPLAPNPGSLEVQHTDQGLRWAFTPPKSRPDLIEALERRDVTGSSWRMIVADDQWEGERRTITRIGELRDITIAGSQQPAYPAAQIEYRTTDPANSQEDTTMAEQAEPQNTEEQPAEDRSQHSGGLHVEDRVEVVPVRRPFMEEISVAAREVSIGEVRSLTTAVSVSNPTYATEFFDLMRPASAFLRSGVRTLTTNSDTIIYPLLTSDPTISWVSEGGTISASDPGLGAGTAVPHKLAVRVEYSNELAEDSAPGIEQILRQVLVARAGVQIDIAAYEGNGVSPQPSGMGIQSGIGNVNASAANTSYLWAGSAVAYLEGQNAPRPFAFVGGSALVRDLRQVVVGTATPLVPPATGGSDGAIPTLYGATGYMANGLAGGTAYVYSPSSCYLVNRTSGFDIEINRARLFDSDRSEMRLRARLDYLFPYPGSICRGTAVP